MKQDKKLELTPLTNAVVAGVVALGVLLFFYFFKFDGNITGFFRIGSVLPLSPYLDPDKALIHAGEIGYDGQQFLTLSFDPFLQNEGTIAALDSPLYRYRRIFYPLLGYVLGLGNRAIIPYVMVTINYLCVVALVWTVSWGLQKTDEPKWHGFLVLCVPGVWMALGFSTADLLSSTLLVLAICCYRYQRSLYTSFAIAGACLTRETMLLGWLALVICSFKDRDWKQLRSLAGAVLPALGWNFYVASKLAQRGQSGVDSNFGLPFVGIFHKFTVIIQAGLNPKNLFETYLFILLIAVFVLTVALALFTPSNNQIILLSASLYAAVFICSSDAILWYFMAYSRVFIDAFFLLLLIAGYSNKTLKIAPLLAGVLPSLAFIFLAS